MAENNLLKNFEEFQKKHEELLSSLHQKMDQLHRKNDRLTIAVDNIRKDLIRTKWETFDRYAELIYPGNMTVSCPICKKSGKRKNLQTKNSFCRFGGGFLERYVCPSCGAIFGPLKMSLLNEQELSEEYRRHYELYSEGDSSFSEEAAFNEIQRGQDKIYLNWGGGIWSSTMQHLKERGYTVYNYEPYAAASKDPFLITDVEQLKEMRFDGIFSNNLLEHLVDPVASFMFMKSLLKDKNSLMAHSTPCFEYAYEYTRFHLVFFTGKSSDVFARKTDLNIVKRYRIEGPGKNFSHVLVVKLNQGGK